MLNDLASICRVLLKDGWSILSGLNRSTWKESAFSMIEELQHGQRDNPSQSTVAHSLDNLEMPINTCLYTRGVLVLTSSLKKVMQHDIIE